MFLRSLDDIIWKYIATFSQESSEQLFLFTYYHDVVWCLEMPAIQLFVH